jgi:hypothetical protein
MAVNSAIRESVLTLLEMPLAKTAPATSSG